VYASDDGLKPLDQSVISGLEFVKFLGLFFKYHQEGIGSVTSINLVCEWMIAEVVPSLLGVLGQGSIKQGLEIGGSGSGVRS
jgi:hypothetical protein